MLGAAGRPDGRAAVERRAQWRRHKNAPDGGTNDFNIVWTNRGQTNDNFAARSAGNAGAARGRRRRGHPAIRAHNLQHELDGRGHAAQREHLDAQPGRAPDFGGQCRPHVGLDASGSPVSATIFLAAAGTAPTLITSATASTVPRSDAQRLR